MGSGLEQAYIKVPKFKYEFDIYLKSMAEEVVVKICLLGDAAVGKTSLIKRFVLDEFSKRYLSTIGAKVTKKSVDLKIKGKKVEMTLMIWDLMGQPEYEFLQATYYKGTQGAIIVCDITRRETLDNIKKWIKGLDRVAKDVPFVLVANKSDLEDSYAFEEKDLAELAKELKVSYIVTSALTGDNVEEAFKILAKEIGAQII